MTPLAPDAAARLDKLLRLLLISDRPGEIAGAAHAVGRLLAAQGCDEHGFVDAVVAACRQKHDDVDAWRDDVNVCLDHPHLLSERETKFLTDLRGWRGRPSEKQLHWLVAIRQRVRHA